MFRTMLQFIFRDSIVYYTSYTRVVLIEIYKLVDKMPLAVLSFQCPQLNPVAGIINN
jgi:hypothetical protein